MFHQVPYACHLNTSLKTRVKTITSKTASTDLLIYEGRTESHEQQFFCQVTYFIIDKLNTPP